MIWYHQVRLWQMDCRSRMLGCLASMPLCYLACGLNSQSVSVTLPVLVSSQLVRTRGADCIHEVGADFAGIQACVQCSGCSTTLIDCIGLDLQLGGRQAILANIIWFQTRVHMHHAVDNDTRDSFHKGLMHTCTCAGLHCKSSAYFLHQGT